MPSLDTPKSFHRIMNVPLDDSSTVNSLEDLLAYCNAKGSVYDGQLVTVNFSQGYTQEYRIQKNSSNNGFIPVPIFKNTEFNIITRGSDKYILLYYRNGSNGKLFSNNILTSLDDIYAYSIINNIPLFIDNNKYTFYMKVNSNEYTWEQAFNPTKSFASPSGTNISGGISYISFVNNSNTYIQSNAGNIFICPKVSNTNVVRLYIKATSYLGKVGVV